MSQIFYKFLFGFFTNRSKDLFVIQLGVKLLLVQWGLTGILGSVAGYFLRSTLGFAMDNGIFVIDVTLDAIKEGITLDEFKDHAKIAYDKATAKVYKEEEKLAIRQEYLDIISKFGAVGGMSV